MTGRREADLDLADAHALAVLQRLLVGVGHVLETRPHDRERLRRGQRPAVARPRMIAMPVRDHRARHGEGRIDIEVAGLAIEAARRGIEPRTGI